MKEIQTHQYRKNSNSAHRRQIALLSASVASLLIASCGSTPPSLPLRSLGSEKIGPVSCHIDPNSDKKASYSSDAAQGWRNRAGASTGTGLLGAIVGGAIAVGVAETTEAAGQSAVNRISQKEGYCEKPAIISNFRDEFKKQGFRVVDNGGSMFVVNLTWYGLWKNSDGLSYPKIAGSAKLTDSGGNPIWQSSGSAWFVPKRTLNDYKAHPDLYKTEFDIAAKAFAEQLVAGNGQFSKEYLAKLAL